MVAADCDVLIIGAGPGGAVAAAEFLAAGRRVVCLEHGAWPNPNEFPGSSPEWEVASSQRWSSSPALRQGPADVAVDTTRSDVGVLDFRGVGGSSVLFAAQWPRLVPANFDGWPIDYAELAPFYEETDVAFGVSALGGNPAYPPGVDPPLPPLPVNDLGLRVAAAQRRLGWHWWPAPNAIASRPYRGRHACVRRGTCIYGCNEGAKGSADSTHWPSLVADGCHLVCGAEVTQIVVDEAGLAHAVRWRDAAGRERTTTTDLVVLAAGGIGTPRLLLTSGLANSSGQVGRNLMVHPLTKVVGVFDGDGTAWQTQAGAVIQSVEFAASDPRRGFVGGATWALGTSGGPVAAAYAAGGAWGAGHHDHVRRHHGNSAFWTVIAEDQPQADNRIVVTDHGVEMQYRLSDNTAALIAWNVERATQSLLAAGALAVHVEPIAANGHFIGTARMGDDPATSVVDRWGRSHDVANLMIVDASVMPTAGSANPTSTLTALSMRAARQAIANAAAIPRPVHHSPGDPLPPATTGPGARVSLVVDVDDAPGRQLAQADRRRFERVAAEHIPGNSTMPTPLDAAIGDRPLDRVLWWRSDMRRPLLDALETLDRRDRHERDDRPGEPAPAATGSPRWNEAVATVRYLAASAYYLAPAVRAALGLDRPPSPPDPHEYPTYVTLGLLDR